MNLYTSQRNSTNSRTRREKKPLCKLDSDTKKNHMNKNHGFKMVMQCIWFAPQLKHLEFILFYLEVVTTFLKKILTRFFYFSKHSYLTLSEVLAHTNL